MEGGDQDHESPAFRGVAETYLLFRLTRWLARGSLTWMPVTVLIPFSALAAVTFAAARFDGTLVADPVFHARGLLSHYGTLANLVGMPLLILLSLYFVQSVTRTVDSAASFNGNDFDQATLAAAGLSPERVRDEFTGSGVERRAVLLLMRMIGIYALIVNAQQTRMATEIYGSDVWDSNAHRVGYVAGRLLLGIEWIYVFPLVAYLLFVGAMQIHRLTKVLVASERVTVNPFSPDRCGGFRDLGQCMLAATYLAIPPLAMVLAHVFTHVNFYFTLAFATGLSVVLALSLLFLPFVSLHRLLVDWKASYQRRLMARIRGLEEQTVAGSSTAPGQDLLACFEVLDRVQTMSTWPYSPIDRLRWLGPAVPVAVSIGLKLASR